MISSPAWCAQNHPLPLFRRVGAAVLLGTTLCVTGCSYLPALPSLQSGESFLGVVTPYRMDIVQGNVVTQEQAARVQPGMVRAQVRDILGSPMLTDPFHTDRWDYIFTIRRQGTPAQQRIVVAHFKGDKLERLEAQGLPSERDFVASISRPVTGNRSPVIALTEDQIKALPKPPAPAAEPGVVMGAVRSYPPLEP